ncbi:hypothetical protein JGH11_03455 [Dysgonomonas sp. Marseille-P4677]|uniref:hypothetical protein n=1 Tax=Dysgonomonas sp. Marseille-P4677 TaxID=2364790 RepID=UPI001911966A|nr:hypothetical protein [Dysgonomonas sp. Marseille-P4677]MBK5719920.1 hypothetical protein [Dysgonomonas sp. Marseille-P4677]
MKRIVTKVIGSPNLINNRWCVLVESKYYNKTLSHILPFDTVSEAIKVHEGYEYMISDILREPPQASFKTLSIQQPYALLAAMGVKDIENRSWKTDYRGRIYIHACSFRSAQNIKYALTSEQKEIVNRNPLIYDFLEDKELMYSAIIGHVDLVDIVEDSSSIWALKDHYHWKLENPVLFESPYINVKGQLGFWDCREYLKK